MKPISIRTGRNIAARRDAAWIVGVSTATAILCVQFDLSEAFWDWSRRHERLQLDELPDDTVHASTADQLAHALSSRELEVQRLLAQGHGIDEIALRLALSPKTAANHQSSIKQKLGAGSALQLILTAQQSGLIAGG